MKTLKDILPTTENSEDIADSHRVV